MLATPRHLAALFALCAALAASPAAVRAAPGEVDWQRKVVKCSGSGAPNLQAAQNNVAVARIGAEKAARLDALRSCMETVKGIQIEAGKTAGGALASDGALAGRVEGAVRGFRVVGKPRYYSDGGVEMDVEVPIEGKLSEALLTAAPASAGSTDSSKAAPAPAAAQPAPGGPTALVIDARGTAVVPALAPRVLDESGTELYGPSRLGSAGRRSGGAAYAKDLDSARRDLAALLGPSPLVVKAIRAEGPDLVIATADARALSGTAAFLAEGRVVVLADRQEGKGNR